MIWKILIITDDYYRYINYFSNNYEKTQKSRRFSRFVSDHTDVEIRPKAAIPRGQKFDLIYVNKESLSEDEYDALIPMSPNIVSIEQLDRKMY